LSDYVGNRLALRVPYKLKLKLKGRNLKEKLYYTQDISFGGVFIPSETSPTLGLPVDVKLYVPSTRKAIAIKGKILRIKWEGNFKKIQGFAVEFKKFDRASEDKYLNFLNKVSRERL